MISNRESDKVVVKIMGSDIIDLTFIRKNQSHSHTHSINAKKVLYKKGPPTAKKYILLRILKVKQ